MAVLIRAEDIGEFKKVSSETHIKVDDGFLPKHRAYRLQDGDIFTTMIEYFESEFYEVELEYYYDENINMITCRYKRTGETFTTKQLEDLANG